MNAMVQGPKLWRRAALSLLWLGTASSLLIVFRSSANLTTVSLVFIVVVTATAMLYGSAAAMLNAIVATLILNYFFIPPIYTWNIRDTDNWVAFAAFAVTAIMVGQLSSRARRSAVESELRRVEIERLFAELQKAFAEASEAQALRNSERLKSALLDAVTHDLRTPLTAIKASATALIDAKHDGEMAEDVRDELLQVIDEESDRLDHFVEQMMGLAMIEGGQLTLNRAPETALAIVNNALDRCSAHLRSHPVEVSMAEELPQLKVDAVTISAVMVELLENATKYSAPDSPIKVTVEEAGGERVRFIVEDRGMGIPADEREKVFQKFYRLKGRDSRGFGMGLSIAKGIVEAHGGRIWAEANPAAGSILKFEIPCEGRA